MFVKEIREFHGASVVVSRSGWLSIFHREVALRLPILWHSEEKRLWRDLYGFLRGDFLQMSHWRRPGHPSFACSGYGERPLKHLLPPLSRCQTMPGRAAMRSTSLLWHREGNVDGEIARGSTMATPKHWVAYPVQSEDEMERSGAMLGDNEEVWQDNFHYRPPCIKFPWRNFVHVRESSHGSWLAIKASSHI